MITLFFSSPITPTLQIALCGIREPASQQLAISHDRRQVRLDIQAPLQEQRRNYVAVRSLETIEDITTYLENRCAEIGNKADVIVARSLYYVDRHPRFWESLQQMDAR